MDKRSYESPMDWEYENNGPMDPSSPFAQSTRKFQNKSGFGGSSFGTFGQASQNSFGRTPSTPSKPLHPTPAQDHTPSIFSSNRLQKPAVAAPFRNPAFTTPRKPHDDPAEISAAESSPAATDGSDFPETPDNDQSLNIGQMTITPSTMSRRGLLFPKKASGKGEIPRTVLASRDKVRKRKRHNADKDVSGYRLPYIQPEECDESDYESDESTFQPNKVHGKSKTKNKDGWFGNFLAAIQRHPNAPNILGYWLNFAFSTICMSGTLWLGWTIIGGLREDFNAARSSVRDEFLEEIAKCRADYIDNRCFPREQRLPAMHELCEQWFACMNKNPDNLKKVQLGAKNIVEILNEIVDTMSYKTIALLVLLFTIFLFSGRSLLKSANHYTDVTKPPTPTYSEPHPSTFASQQVYWQALQPHTPRHYYGRRLPENDETPETDTSPPRMNAILPPSTPSGRKSPSKGERGRSPAKLGSPMKRHWA